VIVQVGADADRRVTVDRYLAAEAVPQVLFKLLDPLQIFVGVADEDVVFVADSGIILSLRGNRIRIGG
jgi:hypothetical protein